MIKSVTNIACSILLVVGFANAHAAVVVDVLQDGSNVVASGGGSISLTGLTNEGGAFGAGAVWAGLSLGSGLFVGPTNIVAVNFYSGLSGPSSFGSGSRILADSGSGDLFSIIANKGLYVTDSYISGSALLASSQWDNMTLTGLGLTTGSYVWTWGSGEIADSFTLNIGDISTVPEPSSVALLGLGIAGLLLCRKDKQA